MSPLTSSGNDALMPSLVRRIERICVRFEGAWKAGQRPNIEDYMGDTPESEHAALLRQLIALDVAYRRLCGEDPKLADYGERFPKLDLREILDRFVRSPAEPGTCRASGQALQALDPAVSPSTESFRVAGSSSEQVGNRLSPTGGDAAAQPVPAKVGRYQIQRLLGEGGFGAVYLGYDEELDRPVAIKFPRGERLLSDKAVADFRREARSVARLHHPGIVKIYDIGQADGLYYIVSEYIEGSSLAERLARGRLAHGEAASLVAQVAEALHFAHLEGLVHRDIKPSNILLDRRGQCHVVDFGLAIWEKDLPAERGHLVGTPLYMSPEQVRGEGHRVDARTDIYSLGVVLYELLCGRRPFAAEAAEELFDQILHREPRPPRTIDDSIPRDLERICLRALAKRIADRHTTAKDLAEELQAVAARLLTAPTPPVPVAAPAPGRKALSDREPLVVPKGLRSFEATDADFFLQLLPGPRDREGLPDSLRFWKTRTESVRPEESFAVGLIYGPSGCGKSSLVKAGLLPRLAKHVVPVYLEATREDTEVRLLAALHQNCPEVKGCSNLRDAFRELRLGRALPAGKKVCIVLDQFEQWLHSHQEAVANGTEESPLLAALRQADGQHVLCLLMVRDDFWLGISRLFQTLEIPLLEGRNSRLVDLFDLRHARRVLELFGQAYGCLPPRHREISKQQHAFLDEALRGLSEQGKVISVRLSLFADMMKGRPWTPETLAEVGGIEGIGVTFLEETFSSRTAPPEHRLHQEAARAVLRHLLPEEGTEIRGKIRSRAELFQVSGYSQRPQDFERLMRILDTELRIVTPTEVLPQSEGAGSQDPAVPSSPAPAAGPCYQLTHDYLVPPLREWLTCKQRETRRGRAELLLKERAGQWSPSRHNRLLPSPSECLRIGLFTRPASWSSGERAMVRRALWVHTRTLGGVAALVAGLALLFALLLLRKPTPLETYLDVQAAPEIRLRAFRSLPLGDDAVFGKVVHALESESDPVVAKEVLAALVERVQVRDQGSEKRQDTFLFLLQKLLEDPSLGPEIHVAAFKALEQVGRPADVVDKMHPYLQADNPGPLRQWMLDYLQKRAREISTGDIPPGAAKPLRDAILRSTEKLVQRGSAATRPEAFQIFASLAPASEILKMVEVQYGPSADARLNEALLAYVRDLDLSSLPDETRWDVLRQMIGLIRKDDKPELVTRCVEQLDKQPAGRLCNWLIKASRDVDVKEVAKNSLLPYARKTQKRDAVKPLGQYIQKRLEELVVAEPGQEILTSYELEYLIQAIGELRAITGDSYPRALDVLSRLLENRSRLEEDSILDTVIGAFAQLNAQKQARLDPLREIAGNVEAAPEIREAAVRALGELDDLQSLTLIEEIATNAKNEKPILTLQEAAIRSLGRLGGHLKRQSKPTEEVLHVLQRLIERYRQDEDYRNICSAAISAFGNVADAKEARFLFPLLSIRYLNTSAVQAIHAILLHALGDCRQVVEDYLRWRMSAPPIPAKVRTPPDEAVVGLAGVYGVDAPLPVKETAVKAIAQALAEAHLDDQEAVRRRAAELLDRVLVVKEAPRLDPDAAGEERKAQLERWKKWWREHNHKLRLTGSSLTASPEGA